MGLLKIRRFPQNFSKDNCLTPKTPKIDIGPSFGAEIGCKGITHGLPSQSVLHVTIRITNVIGHLLMCQALSQAFYKYFVVHY